MRVLVADDSLVFRTVLSEVLASLPEVEVVGQAANGKLAVQRTLELKPDLLSLDMEMPEMDGLAVLDALKAQKSPVAVIVVSALTLQGGRLTIQALQKGAFDFITKPDAAHAGKSRELLRAELAPRIKALALRLGVRTILRGESPVVPIPGVTAQPPGIQPGGPQSAADLSAIGARMARLTGQVKPEMVLIGVSTGGPDALAKLIPALPARLGVPVLIVQHMPPLFTQSLAENLSGKSALKVREAADGDQAEADTVYIAPGGRQMRLTAEPEGRKIIRVNDDPPENNCRPSADYLFRSVAINFPGRALALIMTGMGSDGTLGLRLLKRNGCPVLAQDEASSVVWGMPKAAVEAGVVDEILPLESLAARTAGLIRGAGR